MIKAVISSAQALALREMPCLAVDLGFSGTSRSCGMASRDTRGVIQGRKYTFRECIDSLLDHAASHGQIALVLEAPLSAAFDERNNPCARGAFEGSPKPRWWSLRAGAAMALAAQYFLRSVHQRLEGCTVHLVEGFVVGHDSGDHAEVASHLLAALIGVRAADWHLSRAGSHSILDWLGYPAGQGCPVILAPRYA